LGKRIKNQLLTVFAYAVAELIKKWYNYLITALLLGLGLLFQQTMFAALPAQSLGVSAPGDFYL
jgi:hypothetical protein